MGNKQSQKQLKEDIDFIKQHTSYDDATILEMFEGFKRDCPEGTMTPEQFGEMYKKFIVSSKTQQGNFKLENADKFCEHVFRAFDADKSGSVDFKEFMIACYCTSDASDEEKLKLAFKMYDIDGNGTIGEGEMNTILESYVNLKMVASLFELKDQVKSIFGSMDKNRDGALTEQEFLTAAKTNEKLKKILMPSF